jgi:hypothetical protein
MLSANDKDPLVESEESTNNSHCGEDDGNQSLRMTPSTTCRGEDNPVSCELELDQRLCLKNNYDDEPSSHGYTEPKTVCAKLSSRQKNNEEVEVADDGYLVLAGISIFVNPPLGLLAFMLASM